MFSYFFYRLDKKKAIIMVNRVWLNFKIPSIWSFYLFLFCYLIIFI